VGRASWHDDSVVAPDFGSHPVNPNLTLALLDANELVMIGVDFRADFLAGLQGHQHQLEGFGRVEHSAEVPVALGQFLNVSDETFHGRSSCDYRLEHRAMRAALIQVKRAGAAAEQAATVRHRRRGEQDRPHCLGVAA
jgi:hypothetical protein